MLDESPIGHKLPSPAVLPPTTQSFLLDNDHPHEVSDYGDDDDDGGDGDDNENDYDDNENYYDDKDQQHDDHIVDAFGAYLLFAIFVSRRLPSQRKSIEQFNNQIYDKLKKSDIW